DQRSRVAGELDGRVQLLRRSSGEQLQLSEQHDGAELRLRSAGDRCFLSLPGPGGLGASTIAEEVERAALQLEGVESSVEIARFGSGVEDLARALQRMIRVSAHQRRASFREHDERRR